MDARHPRASVIEEPINRKWHQSRDHLPGVRLPEHSGCIPSATDEVVRQGSLYGKMPGDDWLRFGVRPMFALSVGLNGKKPPSWQTSWPSGARDHDASIDWGLPELAGAPSGPDHGR